LDESLPIHFFTIVLNGEPFIRHHIEVLKELPFPWHWHVVEGVAALHHDTAWSRAQGGTISPQFHKDGLSVDGTRAYLDALARSFPQTISLYRKPAGTFWDGKIEIVRAPLVRLTEPCLLWQIDADELWTVEQICAVRDLFRDCPKKTAAYFYCHYFVGENLVTTTRNTYGNQSSYEWLRVWRYRPGFQWLTHEPPRLCQQTAAGKWMDVAAINPILHAETEGKNLIFHHYAYATRDQVRFKESYYGYGGAVAYWEKLQSAEAFPLYLGDFFPWVKDGTLVDRPASQKVRPLAQRNVLGNWRFRARDLHPAEPATILFVRPDSIGDTILAAGMLAPIRKRHPHARIVVVCQEHVAEIYDACPLVDKVLPIHRQRAIDEADYRNHIARQLQELRSDLCLNSVYSREPLTDFLALASQAAHRVAHEGSTELMAAGVKERHDRLYSKLISCPEKTALELDRHRVFLEGIGINAPFLQPTIWLKDEDEACAEDFFQRHGLEPDSTLALFAGARADCRIYPGYGEALADICNREPQKVSKVIALGAQADYDINQRNLVPLPRASLNVSGQFTLRQTAAILKRCRLAVGGETGLAHIACAVGTPNVIVVGGGHFGRFMPYSPLTSIACLPLECYGCNWQCRYVKPHCVQDLASNVLIEAIRRSLTDGSTKPRVFVQGDSLWRHGAGLPKWRDFERAPNQVPAEIIRVG
jgi:ADP-heptose:LPS heptosyltransferase